MMLNENKNAEHYLITSLILDNVLDCLETSTECQWKFEEHLYFCRKLVQPRKHIRKKFREWSMSNFAHCCCLNLAHGNASYQIGRFWHCLFRAVYRQNDPKLAFQWHWRKWKAVTACALEWQNIQVGISLNEMCIWKPISERKQVYPKP